MILVGMTWKDTVESEDFVGIWYSITLRRDRIGP